MNDILKLEENAKASALNHVVNMLQVPDQLEKVEQHRKRVCRKKASVEAMLKTAVQSQLDGVKTGLQLLSSTKEDIADTQKKLDEAEHIYAELSKLSIQLQDVREESIRHSQMGAAMENLKHIFNVPGSVAKTQDLISEGKLLAAHKALSDLESSRDDLMYELHKLPNQSSSDKNMLKQYFADVERLSDELGKQLWVTLKRTLNTVRKEPQVIVTALRLIMREEWADEAALRRSENNGFLPPGRPKLWRKKAMETLEQSVAEKLEANQIEVRQETKMWLARHLEQTRMMIIEDLKTVKHHCTPCFPPQFDIFNEYVRMYHNCLSQRLQTIIAQGLVDIEYIHILSWLNTYNSRELMMHPDVNVDVSKYEALLPDSTINKLMEKYLRGVQDKFEEWLRNALHTDHKDWQSSEPPEVDSKGYYRTAAPMLIYQMIAEHIQLAKTANPKLVSMVLRLAMDQMDRILESYLILTADYKTQNFEDRSRFHRYTAYMTAISNNAVVMEELFTKLCDGKPPSEPLRQKLAELGDKSLDYLCEEVIIDYKGLMNDVMTKKWLSQEVQAIDTMCATLDDYGGDYVTVIMYKELIKKLEQQVANSYVRAICDKRMSFKTYDERRPAAELILSDTEKLNTQFGKLYDKKKIGYKKDESKLEVLKLMGEVLKMKDNSLLSLEMSGLIKKFPEVSAEDLTSLLELRGDINRNEARTLIGDLKPGTVTDRNILSNILPL